MFWHAGKDEDECNCRIRSNVRGRGSNIVVRVCYYLYLYLYICICICISILRIIYFELSNILTWTIRDCCQQFNLTIHIGYCMIIIDCIYNIT